jgi:hypothetical protein
MKYFIFLFLFIGAFAARAQDFSVINNTDVATTVYSLADTSLSTDSLKVKTKKEISDMAGSAAVKRNGFGGSIADGEKNGRADRQKTKSGRGGARKYHPAEK